MVPRITMALSKVGDAVDLLRQIRTTADWIRASGRQGTTCREDCGGHGDGGKRVAHPGRGDGAASA